MADCPTGTCATCADIGGICSCCADKIITACPFPEPLLRCEFAVSRPHKVIPMLVSLSRLAVGLYVGNLPVATCAGDLGVASDSQPISPPELEAQGNAGRYLSDELCLDGELEIATGKYENHLPILNLQTYVAGWSLVQQLPELVTEVGVLSGITSSAEGVLPTLKLRMELVNTGYSIKLTENLPVLRATGSGDDYSTILVSGQLELLGQANLVCVSEGLDSHSTLPVLTVDFDLHTYGLGDIYCGGGLSLVADIRLRVASEGIWAESELPLLGVSTDWLGSYGGISTAGVLQLDSDIAISLASVELEVYAVIPVADLNADIEGYGVDIRVQAQIPELSIRSEIELSTVKVYAYSEIPACVLSMGLYRSSFDIGLSGEINISGQAEMYSASQTIFLEGNIAVLGVWMESTERSYVGGVLSLSQHISMDTDIRLGEVGDSDSNEIYISSNNSLGALSYSGEFAPIVYVGGFLPKITRDILLRGA